MDRRSEEASEELARLRAENARLSNALRESKNLLGIAPAFFGFLDRQAVIRVHNEGNPIPRELWSTLFEPFRRADAGDAAQKGWGLGLTLVRGMAEAHGGSVEIESGAEAGTTFTVTLPRDT